MVDELWFLLERPSLFSASPLRSNVDAQFKSIQQFPVDVNLKFRKQCKRKENQSKSRGSEGINQKKETRKREKLSRDKFVFARRKKKKSMLGYETEKKEWYKSLMCFLRVKKLLLFARPLYQSLLIPVPAGKDLKGKAV